MSEYDVIRKRKQTGQGEYDVIRNRKVAPKPTLQQRIDSGALPPVSIRQSPILSAAPAPAPAPATPPPVPKVEAPGFLSPFKSIVNRPKQVAQKALDIVGRPSEILAEYLTPDAPLIGGPEAGKNARESFLERTGQQPATGIAEKGFGLIGSSLHPLTGAAPLRLERAAANIVQRFLPRLGGSLPGRITRGALTEAAAEAPLAAGQELATGSGDLSEAAEQAAIGGALGAGIGGAIPAIGRLKSIIKKKPSATSPIAPTPAVQQPLPQVAEAAVPQIMPVTPPAKPAPTPIKARRAEKPAPPKKEPTRLYDLVRSKGHAEVTPETVAQTYNSKNWYHGTGTDKLTKETLDPFVGSHESLFGQGVYLTDNPTIAEGYAGSRSKRSKTPTVYETNVNMNRVLDLEKLITPDVADAILKAAKPLDYYDDGYIYGVIREEIEKLGATPEKVIQKLRSEIADLSQEQMVSSNEFVENFQDLAINLKKAGYDGLTHTGGTRTGNDAHRVLILLDPQDTQGAGIGQVSKLDKYVKPEPPAKRPVTPTVFANAKARQAPPVTSPVAPPEVPPVADTSAMDVLKNAGQVAKETIQEIGDVMTGGRNSGISPFRRTNPYSNLKTDTKSQLVSRSKREPKPTGGRKLDWYTDLVDDVYRLKEADQIAERANKAPLKQSESAYELALASRYSDQISKQNLTDKLVDAKGNVVSGSLKDALSDLEPGKMVDFEDYLLNRHAITRMEDRGEKVFDDKLEWTPDIGREKVAAYEAANPKFAEMADKVYEFQNNMVQHWLVDTGIITQKTADAWREANPYYVPNKRYFTELEKQKGGRGLTKRGYAGQAVPVRKYEKGGSQRKVISPIESMIENVDAFVKAAKRNQSMQALVRNVKQHPDEFEGLLEIVEPPKKLDDVADIDLSSAEGLEDVLARLEQDFSHAMQTTRKDRDNIVRVLMDGEPAHLKINDKGLLQAVTAMGPDQVGKVFGAIGKVTNFMKTLTTGVNPIFVFTRSLLRDIPQAYIASKSTNNPIEFGADLFEAAWSIMANKELYKQFKRMGGGHTASVAADRNLLAQSKRKILPAKGGRLAGAVPRSYDFLQNVLNATESATRLGEFKRLGKSGDVDDRLLGLFESQEVATNFKRRGRLTRELDALFPYFNAAVQGLDKFVRTYKDNPKAATVKSFLAVTIPTMVAYAFNYDNPDYQKLSNATKDNFILIPRGDGTFVRIAKPKEIGTVFSDIPERLLRQFFQQDPDAFRKFANQLRETFTLPGINGAIQGFGQEGITGALSGFVGDSIAGPVVGAAMNENWAGSPIVPGYLQNASPKLQYDSKTSAPAKIAGKLTGTSPMKLDYVAKQYLGGVGQIGIPALSAGGGTGVALERQVTADPVYSNDIMDKFYSAKEKLDRAKADANISGDLPKWYNDGQRKQYDRVSDAIGAMRKRMREIEEDLSIPAARKREQLRQLREQMNQLAERVISTSPINK
ncbi:LPD38 domain-containing protein [Paenibacillus koleovorans]|uniref:LPD38 domain-containing protein n=1 Tax=Paenibacillus koleovorans TaxID=121608 RepID=UPI000FDCAA7E|nr:LPD38 domain-containing protein [Paenibacillus koleovorans]